MNLLGYVIVGAFVGLLAELLKKGRNWGLAGDVVEGSLIALIGGLLFGGGLWSNVVVALFAVISLVVFLVIKKV